MIGAAVNSCRRKFRVEIARRVAEQVQQCIAQRGIERRAARRRRLQRGCDGATVALPRDGNDGIVQMQPKTAIAEAMRERRAERDGGVAAEGHFHQRREVADAPGLALGRSKGGLGEADLGRGRLHCRGIRQGVADPDTGGIAAIVAVREGCDTEERGHEVILVATGDYAAQSRISLRSSRATLTTDVATSPA
jgi:hypothetical protein